MDWNKLPKYVFYTLLSIVIGYIIFFITTHVIFRPGLSLTECEENRQRFFSAELRKQFNPICGSRTGKYYAQHHYIVKNKFYIDIWEFKNTKHLYPNIVYFEENKNLSDITFWSGVTLHSNTDYPVTIKYNFDFDDGMQIQLDERGKIEQQIYDKNYQGFYGIANRLTLCDGEGKPQIYFDYLSTKEPLMVLVYRAYGSFFVITANSTNSKDFDYEYIINNLNLN